MSIHPTAIVMTATITPNPGTPLLSRSDPEVRMEDYKQALKFYLNCSSNFIDRIIFIDNSNTELSPLSDLVESMSTNKKVDLISFDGNNHPPSYGKGFGEFRLLDYGLEKTSLLKRLDTFWKVTGRLSIINIEKLIKTAPDNYELYCDLRNVPLIGHTLGGNQWMDLRLFSCTMNGYDKIFRGIYPELNESSTGMSPEQYIFPLLKHPSIEGVCPRFRIQPMLAGVGGHKNINYRSKNYIMKEKLRSFTRFALPWLWL